MSAADPPGNPVPTAPAAVRSRVLKPIHYLTAYCFFTHGAMSAARVLVALYAVHMQSTPFVVGALVALFALVPMLGSVQFGRFADRMRARTPLLVFTLASTAGMLVSWFWEHTAALLLTGAVVGGAYGVTNVFTASLAGRHGGPAQRAVNFSWIGIGISAANGAGPLIAGFAIDHIGFAAATLVIACMPLAALPLIVFRLLPAIDAQPERPKAAPGSPARITDLLLHKAMFPVYFMGVLFMLAYDIFIVMTPVYGAQLRLSASLIGIVLSTFSIAVFAMRAFAAPISRAFTPWQVMLMSLVLSAASLGVYGLVQAVPLLMLCAFAMGAGNAFGTPMSQTELVSAAPAGRSSEALGLRFSVGMACQFVLPLVAGSAASLVGVEPLFWMVALLLIAGGWRERHRWNQPRPR